ncbi:hypothetical protein [Sphingomonas sp.]|uniref:hypothetical protein n=1 Tax=Sphingomonas sp. TaxID=28214 RepID=UPI003B3B2E4A
MSQEVMRGGPLALIADMFRLWVRFLPQLLALGLGGLLLNELMIQFAVWLGYHNRLAGLLSLTVVVLIKLIIIVAMFEVLRPALPAIGQASQSDPGPAIGTKATPGWRTFPGIVSRALVPFFAYYAAWGFLGDTIREYAREGLGQFNPFDPTYSGSLFDVSGGWWLIGSVAILWAIRRGAKALKKNSDHPALSMLIVLCEAGWTFIGLYVITQWKGGIFKWFADRRVGDIFQGLWQAITHPVGTAQAALPGPVEAASADPVDILVKIFFSALLPVVWLALAALIYRYDVHDAKVEVTGTWSRRVEGTVNRWQSLPSWLRDFVGHFWAGTAKRYRAAANSVYLAAAAGIVPLVVMIVLYRALDWLAAWAWVGATKLVGPHSLDIWQGVANQIAIVLGPPSFPGDGIIPQTLKICLLAATLEWSFRAGRAWRALNK